jgi:hypothetical protein
MRALIVAPSDTLDCATPPIVDRRGMPNAH